MLYHTYVIEILQKIRKTIDSRTSGYIIFITHTYFFTLYIAMMTANRGFFFFLVIHYYYKYGRWRESRTSCDTKSFSQLNRIPSWIIDLFIGPRARARVNKADDIFARQTNPIRHRVVFRTELRVLKFASSYNMETSRANYVRNCVRKKRKIHRRNVKSSIILRILRI